MRLIHLILRMLLLSMSVMDAMNKASDAQDIVLSYGRGFLERNNYYDSTLSIEQQLVAAIRVPCIDKFLLINIIIDLVRANDTIHDTNTLCAALSNLVLQSAAQVTPAPRIALLLKLLAYVYGNDIFGTYPVLSKIVAQDLDYDNQMLFNHFSAYISSKKLE